MNPTSSGQSKVYLEIVKQLRAMIEQDGLKPGDKIPSERELCERLNVGRSSVREALRALELLGLIETRRGEGTFIRDFRDHQLVQLLSTFILQDKKVIRDVKETKYLIELDCLRLIVHRKIDDELNRLIHWVQSKEILDDEFFLRIVELADNRLFLRIWIILKDYYNALKLRQNEESKEKYLFLITALKSQDEQQLIDAYRQLRNLSKS
ncbi:GntR family transcriptional regulator [Cytobacillus spongiae]|nr:GntR family transcriptional regulator [Cytobacillus spongiae]UII57974.1 GntR family transcriptional regulator [Cytobacillus spongiae]